MELMMIECCVCEEVFVTKNETGEHKCQKCDSKNCIYVFDEDVTEEELGLYMLGVKHDSDDVIGGAYYA